MAIKTVPTGPKPGAVRPIRRKHPVLGVQDAGEDRLLSHRSKGIPMSAVNPRLAGSTSGNGYALGTKVSGHA